MEYVEHAEPRPEPISIARCRELLGEDAESMTDQDTEYGVRGKRGDFEPLISEDLFYRVQAVLSGRLPSTTPQQRAHTRTSHSAPSYAATPVVAASPAAGRRGVAFYGSKCRLAKARPEPDLK